MADALIHSEKGYQLKVYPIKGDIAPIQIDRVQSFDTTPDLNRTKVEEVGRDSDVYGVVGYLKGTPTVSSSMTQYEYGNFKFWRKLANKSDATTDINLGDFSTSYFDLTAYMTDDDDNFVGTFWLKDMRVNGFSFNIGDPDAIAERSFDFVGEDAVTWLNDNKYFIYKRESVESGELGSGNTFTVTLDDPQPVQDPDDSDYIKRVARVRSGTTTELTSGTDYSFSAPQTLTIDSAQVGDVYKIYYTGSSYITGEDIWTPNDSDVAGIKADSCEIYMRTSNYLYKMQSLTIDVSFDREDNKEIGNPNVVQRGVRDKTVTITLGALLDRFDLEAYMRNKATTYGKIDIREFPDDTNIVVKVYEDNTKTTFKCGFKATALSPTQGLPLGASVDNYVTKGATLEGTALLITSDESSL